MSATVGAGLECLARPAPSSKRRVLLGRRAQALAGASVAYNAVEAVAAIAAGAAASSIALVGFGLDSIVDACTCIPVLDDAQGSGCGCGCAEQGCAS